MLTKIDRKMTLREVMQKYPKTREVFDKYGLLECGGPAGPPEPIAFFARVHRVDEKQLLSELNTVIEE